MIDCLEWQKSVVRLSCRRTEQGYLHTKTGKQMKSVIQTASTSQTRMCTRQQTLSLLLCIRRRPAPSDLHPGDLKSLEIQDSPDLRFQSSCQWTYYIVQQLLSALWTDFVWLVVAICSLTRYLEGRLYTVGIISRSKACVPHFALYFQRFPPLHGYATYLLSAWRFKQSMSWAHSYGQSIGRAPSSSLGLLLIENLGIQEFFFETELVKSIVASILKASHCSWPWESKPCETSRTMWECMTYENVSYQERELQKSCNEFETSHEKKLFQARHVFQSRKVVWRRDLTWHSTFLKVTYIYIKSLQSTYQNPCSKYF